MTDDPKQMMFLVGLAEGLITFAEEKLDATPFAHGDETRIRFWATLLAKVQERYHEELLALAKAKSQ
jgi:hypothetical protein